MCNKEVCDRERARHTVARNEKQVLFALSFRLNSVAAEI
jgi:hypothetical protein